MGISAGHIYVIKFGNGITKVGRSKNVKRLKTYSQYCNMANTYIKNKWVSPILVDSKLEELHLIKNCKEVGSLSFGMEWFEGIDFEDIVCLSKLFMDIASEEDVRRQSAALKASGKIIFDGLWGEGVQG